MNPHLIELESSSYKPYRTKLLVVGAGPAGISFGNCLARSTKDFLIVDMGADLGIRDRDDPFDCVAGAGGAGLFSDGKFSFFPSGTAIWTLPHQNILSDSYKELQDLFKDSIETEIPEFPSDADISRITSNSSYELKKYPCFYISLEKRKQLIRHMTKEIPKILYNHKMVDWGKVDGKYRVKLEDTKTLQKKEIECEQLVLAGGRFFPLFLNEKKVAKTFKRYEYGVRLVGRNEQFLKVKQEEILDPKWMYRPSPELEFRTFCMCKDGEYVCSNFMGIQSYSGRADVPATGYTNFGLTSRIKAKNNEDFERVLKCGPFEEPLMAVIKNPQMLEVIFGEELGKIYMKGLLKFIENFELKPEELKILGPSIEGVGEYPKINENLQVENENIFVIGDSSGIFRGIIPSMISGIYIANLIKENFL